MELRQFCSQSRVVIVAGKGGVGKTTVTAALALAATRAGLSVLICEIEGKSGLAAAFDSAALEYDEIELAPTLRARTIAPNDAMVDYLESHGMKRMSRRLANSGALDVVATAVPGMKDILVLGKIKSLEQEAIADLIIVDAPAAGHAITFLMAAQGLLDAVRVGPIRKQAAEVAELLHDPARCQVILVTLPEETPVNELIETAYEVEERAGVALGPVVINGCLADLGTAVADATKLGASQFGAPENASPEFGAPAFSGDDIDARVVANAHAAVAFQSERRTMQQAQLARLASSLPLPQIELPQLLSASIGRPELEALADALVQGIEAL